MLKVSDIHQSFGARKVLDGVSFELGEASLVGLIGPSGGGKSTLLKIMAEVLKADSGAVSLGLASSEGLSLMFQEGALFDSLSVFDNVAFPLVGGRVPTYTLDKDTQESVRSKVSEILSRVGLSKAAEKVPAQLSGGMRRRVALARALVPRPKLLLLDDPTAGLDPVASSVIMNLIVELYQEYRPTTVIVSHDLRRLIPIVDRILALFDGRILFDGPVSELESFRHSLLHKFVASRYDFV
ncbi:MAG: ATP-binding cassette domain-containing protein [Deltaproteobacteria bacterium]|nr:ATP-binding cassette domain-containing protein [Deltaproteobacteria bacterium]